MPIIDLPCCINGDYVSAVEHIIGIMLFPKSAEKRKTLETAFELERIASISKSSPHSFIADLPPSLVAYTPPMDIIIDAGKKINHGPKLAACQLLLTIGGDPKFSSLNLSRDALDNGFKNQRAASKSTQIKAWNDFMIVSHLWAAFEVFQDAQAFPKMTILPDFPCHPSQLSLFLALAEEFRKAGEAFRLPRSRAGKYLLETKKMWKLSASIQLDVPETLICFQSNYPMLRTIINERSNRYK